VVDGDQLGSALALSRDVLAVGSPCAPYMFTFPFCGNGATNVWTSLNTATPKAFSLVMSGGVHFGAALALGDYHGDKLCDVAVGAPKTASDAGSVIPYSAQFTSGDYSGQFSPLNDGAIGGMFGSSL
jgi:hypothetical protein